MPHFKTVALALIVFLLAAAPVADGVPSLDGGTGWLNGPAITASDLQGKVVLVDFWAYTCINCLRTLPYLRNLYDRYHNDGFVLVSVHTPEFDFEGDKANVAAAASRLGVTWPVDLDGKQTIWDRYHNDSWPHEYLYDQTGHLVESAPGEGNYQATEHNVQVLLHRTNPQLSFPPVMALLPQDSYDKPGAVCYPRTAEALVYGGAIGNQPSSGGPAAETRMFSDPGGKRKDGGIFLNGLWDVTQFAARSRDKSDTVALHYHAIQVVGVLTPEDGKSIRVDVTQDDAPLAKADAGADIQFDAAGKSFVTVNTSRAYDLVMNAKYGDHELALHPEADGLDVYSFAFESCEVPS